MPMSNRNNNQGNNNQGGQPQQQQRSSFGAASDPFSQAGSNIFDSLAQRQQAQQGGMEAPQSGPGGMPVGAQQHPNMQSQAPNGGNMGAGMLPNGGQQSQGTSPLDNFAPKPDNDPNAKGEKPAATPEQQQQEARDLFGLGQEDFDKYTAEANYINQIDEEVATKALQGDMGALQQLLNSVARSAVSQSAFMSTRIAGQGVQNRLDKFGREVPNMINEHSTKQMFVNDSTMNHPAMKPMVESAMNAMKAQHPQASPQELHSKVKEYMNTMASVLSGNQQQEQQASQPNQQPERTMSDFFQQD